MIGYNQLMAMLGSWVGEEQLFETAWTAAGKARGELTIARGPGEAVLLNYHGHSDAGTLEGHGVVTAGAWWWFDSYGFVPVAPGSARWEDDRLVLERSSERGRTTTTLRIVGSQLEHRIDSAVPAAAELRPLLLGRYALQPQANPGSD